MHEKIKSLSLEQKVGQLFFIGLPTIEVNEETKQLLSDVSAGGVCIFARNVRQADQTRKLLDDLRGILPIEPILAVDQEGGLVDRFRRILTPIPSPRSIRQHGDVQDATTLARVTAEVERILGFNMNFSPVVDIIDDEREKLSNGLYTRVFGKTTDEVIDFAGNYLTELQRGGVFGCLKHFPGIGAGAADPHEDLTIVDMDKDQLKDFDLKPYKELMKRENDSKVNAIMIGHAGFPHEGLCEADANGKLLPSTLSKVIVSDLLRDELGFKGLILTDDMEMGAIVKNYGVGEASKMAFIAGSDMILICSSLDAIREGFETVLLAVKRGEISEKRLDESLHRIADFKARLAAPLEFSEERLKQLSEETAVLNEKLNYSYGG